MMNNTRAIVNQSYLTVAVPVAEPCINAATLVWLSGLSFFSSSIPLVLPQKGSCLSSDLVQKTITLLNFEQLLLQLLVLILLRLNNT